MSSKAVSNLSLKAICFFTVSFLTNLIALSLSNLRCWGNVLSSFTLSDSEQTATGDWVNVGGNADLEFLVLQKGATLYFYNKGALPYSNQVESNSINLSSYQHSGSAGADTAKCQFTSIKGNLVVSSPEINTIAIVYSYNIAI